MGVRNQRGAATGRAVHQDFVRKELNPSRVGIGLAAVFLGLAVVARGLAEEKRVPAPAEGQVAVAAALEMGEVIPRDHVPCPGCGACCVDLPGIPGNCLEVTPLDCVMMFGGNPQEVGTDCHDFNGTPGADACEPGFPLCAPLPDGTACDGACPGPLPCNAQKVRINLSTFSLEVLECGCRDCRVCIECDAFPPPCTGSCPLGFECDRSEVCYTPDICDITCNCVEKGAWGPPFDFGFPGELIVPIHAMVVPVRDNTGRLRGQVFAYDDHVEENNLHTYLWDPETGLFTKHELPVISVIRDCPGPLPPALGNLFCSGHSLLADGKVLVTSGHIIADDLNCPNGYAFSGHVSAHVFDPFEAATGMPWTRVQDMGGGRWYPTNTALPDGRVLTTSGFDACGYCDGDGNPVSILNPQVEVYSPPTPFSPGGWSLAGLQEFPLYPWMHLLSTGSVIYSGPGTDSRLSDPPYGVWPFFAQSMLYPWRGSGTSVLVPGVLDRVMILGGGCTGCNPFPATTNTTEIIDPFLPMIPPTWRRGPAMHHARRHLNAVLLPDGGVLAVGGRSDSEDPFVDPVLPVYEAELYDPLRGANRGWQRMAAMTRPRMYHSTALLLPDGRVFSAGGTYVNPSFPSETNAEIYSPPYLFRGARPVIQAAPEEIGYGQQFSVSTPAPIDITSVVLMRLGSVTHSNNMEQRYVPLAFELSPLPEGLLVTAPANGKLAPPGYYMLFILNSQHVPSEAAIVHLGSEEACCLPFAAITCQMLDPAACTAIGGTPLGPGSACQGSGTCCYDITDDLCIYDTCVDQDGACCAAAGGVFQGVGSTCDIQACCIDGVCCDLDEDCCVISGGVAAGAGTACAGIVGACCYDGDSDGFAEVCLEVDAACCAELDGFFHGPNSTCSPNFGACCFGFTGGSCIEMNESCCADLEAGTFFGHGSVCLGDLNGNGFDDTCEGEPQACCLPHFAVTCQERLPADCFALGGIPQGSGTLCLGHEACCLPDGSCTFVDRICCDDLGGTSLGAGTFCEGTGACCRDVTDDQFLYDTCDDRDKACCEAEGGLFQGVGTFCDIQACCLDGVCGMLDPNCCQLSGGVPAGSGTTCFGGGPGACCYDTDLDTVPDTCFISDEACCIYSGGIFHGVGSTCSNNFGACCFGFTGGACEDMNESCCGDLEAGTFLGPGSFCLGDGNGNGFDDACESEACCFGDRCTPLSPNDCLSMGGIPQGPGSVCRPYGDVHPKPAGDGDVDVDDILKVLDAFVDPATYPNGDIHPCGGDGDVDVDDILAILDAFSGIFLCPDQPCP